MTVDTVKEIELKTHPFVTYLLNRIHNDTGFTAALKRADNPATEYQSWEFLAPWCELNNSIKRKVYATIAAAVAHEKPLKDGYLRLGRAIASSYDDGNNSDAAKAKLRRLIACDSIEEVCSVLRSLLRLIQSRGIAVNYSELLKDLLYYGENTRVKWASEFYGRREE